MGTTQFPAYYRYPWLACMQLSPSLLGVFADDMLIQEGHLKEQNYGADWGDYASFVKSMRAKAKAYDVDLLLIDCGVCYAEPRAWPRRIWRADSGIFRTCMMALA